MAARLWTALLVLVGVFVMHGAQCAAADGAAHSSPATHSTVVAGIAPVGTVLADSPPAAHQATGSPAAVAADSPLSDSHQTAGHLWTVCLAVLAAALAVLLAVLLPHPVLTARLALTRARAQLRSLTPARPPDLSELCLLRI